MKIDGRLKINGKILVIPLNGKGNCTIDASKFPQKKTFYFKNKKKLINFHFDQLQRT